MLRQLVFLSQNGTLTNCRGARGRLRVKGPDNSVLHEAVFRTDDFGIAACDWAIPPDAGLGNYQVVTELVDRESGAEGTTTFRVERYDLPKFHVSVATDRPYYFPGQQPIVSVIGRYLFGKPLTGGHVRILHPARSSSLLCSEQPTEELLAEGSPDESRSFRANLDLTGLYRNPRVQRSEKFVDVDLVAEFTDETTGKVQQTPFQIRVTREPIHVYVLGRWEAARHEEFRTFITTFYPDGTPARCTVEVAAPQATGPPVVERTNRFGLAEVRLSDPPCEPGRLTVTATDADGRTGRATESLDCWNWPWLILETPRTILPPGAPIDIQVRADPRIHGIAVDVLKSADEEELLASRTVSLAKAHASLTIPYRSSFRGELAVVAYPIDGTSDPELIATQAPIIYPTGERLHLDLATDCKRYLPDEDGSISMRTFDATGRPINGAVGLVAVDRALEKLEGEQRRDPFLRNWSQLAGDDDGFSGLSRKAIEGRDPEAPVSAALEMAARLLSRDTAWWPRWVGRIPDWIRKYRGDSGPEAGDVTRERMEQMMKPMYEAMDTFRWLPYAPARVEEIRAIARTAGIDPDGVIDGWGRHCRLVETDPPGAFLRIALVSAGPDGWEGTPDDPQSRCGWNWFQAAEQLLGEAMDTNRRLGKPIRDVRALASEAARRGLRIDALRDPWGHRLRAERFGVDDRALLAVTSAGPDGLFGTTDCLSGDDVVLWSEPLRRPPEERATPAEAPALHGEWISDGTIVGQVTDEQGGSLPRVSVTLLGEGLRLTLPPEARVGSAHGTLRLYPNLKAHLVENVEAIMQRPWGCSEQTVSSAYPSLFLLDLDTSAIDPKTRGRALRYVERAVKRLYHRHAEGGFSYFNGMSPDVAVTAYAIAFLDRARRVVSVKHRVIKKAVTWLAGQQGIEGGFTPNSRWREARRTVITAHVAQSLAPVAHRNKTAKRVTKRALAYLASRLPLIDEPRVLAATIIAAEEFGEPGLASAARRRLAARGKRVGDRVLFDAVAATPFGGYGRSARLEATALSVEALASSGAAGDRDLARRGLAWLLLQQDRIGGWYTTQTTVRTLGAMLAMLKDEQPTSGKVAVKVNGKYIGELGWPAGSAMIRTMRLDSSIVPGANEILIERHAGGLAEAQAILSYVIPWKKRDDGSDAMHLAVTFDKTAVKAGETVTCRVAAISDAPASGMWVAEIGLPPGSALDRQSLERLRYGAAGLLDFEIQPDRVVLYLWPFSGRSNLAFTFRPRFEMQAMTAPSLLVDYYAPERRSVVPPVSFAVAGRVETEEVPRN